jgi:hypothetical protein
MRQKADIFPHVYVRSSGIVVSRPTKPVLQPCSRAGPGCPLSLGERAGVRGNPPPNRTSPQKQISAPTVANFNQLWPIMTRDMKTPTNCNHHC